MWAYILIVTVKVGIFSTTDKTVAYYNDDKLCDRYRQMMLTVAVSARCKPVLVETE